MHLETPEAAVSDPAYQTRRIADLARLTVIPLEN